MLSKIGVLCFWLGIWQLAAMSVGHSILLPLPSEVILELGEMFITSSFWITITYSTSKIMLGLMLGLVLGFLFSVLSFRYRIIKSIIHPAVTVLKSVPVASFIILILVWISSDSLSITISAIMSFPIVYTNLYSAFINLDPQLSEMSSVFRLTSLTRLRYIYLPQILPYFKSAVLICVGFCFKSGITAEIIGLQPNTIGDALHNSKMYLDIPNLFAWTLVIIALSFLLERISTWLISKIEV